MLTVPGRKLGSLAAVAVLLAAAFVVAPPTLAGARSSAGLGDERDLTEALRAAFVEYWHSGVPAFSPRLEQVVDHWFRYHVVKAGIAAIVAAGLVVLSVAAWRRSTEAAAPGRAAGRSRVSFGVLTAVTSLILMVIAVANTATAADPAPALAAFFAGGW